MFTSGFGASAPESKINRTRGGHKFTSLTMLRQRMIAENEKNI